MAFRSHRAKQNLVLISCLVVLLSLRSFAQPAMKAPFPHHFKVVELPLKPLHLSDSGEIVGTVENHRAAIWSEPRGLRTLPAVKGFARSEARSSNQAGHVVGSVMDKDDSSFQAFVYAAGKLTLLPGRRGKALAINDSGQIVGESTVKGKMAVTAVVWQKSSITDLGGCCGGVARAINNHGQVVGDMYDQEGRYRAFLWERVHGLQHFGPPENYSTAIAINDAGHVLVQEMEKGFFVYENKDKLTWLDIPKRELPQARAMNNADVVGGAFEPYADAYRAFIWDEKHGFHDLNELIPAGSGWKLQDATWINNAEQIVGVGKHNGEDDVGFLLLPQEPDAQSNATGAPEKK